MRIATWNVNSVRIRLPRLLAYLQREAPNVVCLQELKCTNDKYPGEAIAQLGYQSAIYGQPGYNGVAILANSPLEDVTLGMEDALAEEDQQARIIAASVAGIRIVSVYVPNGNALDHPSYQYKLVWLERLHAYLQRQQQRFGLPLLVAGDFNVAPQDGDVAQPEQWQDSVLCHGQVRQALAKVVGSTFVDVFAKHHPGLGQYSWWHYRALAFAKNNGLRIDLLYADGRLATRSSGARILRDERKGEKPSDHVPVEASFAWP